MFSLGGELGFLNCDDICMCVVNKQFELLEFVLIPFMLTCNIMRFLSLLLLGLCAYVVSVVIWSVCEHVLVPYMEAVDAVTMMCVLMYCMRVC